MKSYQFMSSFSLCPSHANPNTAVLIFTPLLPSQKTVREVSKASFLFMCRILFSHTSRPCSVKNIPQSFDCAIFLCVLFFHQSKNKPIPFPDPFLYTLLAFIFKLKKICIYSRSAAIFSFGSEVLFETSL